MKNKIKLDSLNLNSFKPANTDLILRNLIFVVLYFASILIFFNYLLWPMITKFKTQLVIEKKQKLLHGEALRNYEMAKDRLSSFIKENNNALEKLNNANGEEILKKLATSSIFVKKITRLESKLDSENYINEVSYEIEARVDDLKKLWDLFLDFEKSNASIVFNLPIKINKLKADSRIFEVVFRASIAKSTYEVDELTNEILQ